MFARCFAAFVGLACVTPVITVTYEIGGTTEIITGVRTALGISRAKQPGTVVADGRPDGTWFGRKLP